MATFVGWQALLEILEPPTLVLAFEVLALPLEWLAAVAVVLAMVLVMVMVLDWVMAWFWPLVVCEPEQRMRGLRCSKVATAPTGAGLVTEVGAGTGAGTGWGCEREWR